MGDTLSWINNILGRFLRWIILGMFYEILLLIKYIFQYTAILKRSLIFWFYLFIILPLIKCIFQYTAILKMWFTAIFDMWKKLDIVILSFYHPWFHGSVFFIYDNEITLPLHELDFFMQGQIASTAAFTLVETSVRRRLKKILFSSHFYNWLS